MLKTFAFEHSSFLKYFHIFCWIFLVMKIACIPSIIMCFCMYAEKINILVSSSERKAWNMLKKCPRVRRSFAESVGTKLHQNVCWLLHLLNFQDVNFTVAEVFFGKSSASLVFACCTLVKFLKHFTFFFIHFDTIWHYQSCFRCSKDFVTKMFANKLRAAWNRKPNWVHSFNASIVQCNAW